MRIGIVDDGPIGVNDSATVPAGSQAPISGNVLSNDISGADNFPAGAGVTTFGRGETSVAAGGTVQGQYGTLTINANGTYTYDRGPNTPGGVSEAFTYGIVDQDGSTSSATLTITIADSPAVITFVPETGDGTVVREPHLPGRGDEPAGSAFDGNAESTTGTITFNSPDGVASLTISGTTVTPGALPQQVFSDATGTLVITSYSYNPATGVGSITYTYTLGDNTLNTNGTTVVFPITVTDLDGDSASDSLTITIVDDSPVAVADTDAIAAGEYGPVTGNVITDAAVGDSGDGDTGADTVGADGAAVTAISGFGGAGAVDGTTTGQYGVLTLKADGSYSYARNPGTKGGVSDVFTYTITDGDGDPATSTLTIAIDDARPVTGENGLVQLDDDALAGGIAGGTGDDADAVNLTGTLAGSGGDGPLVRSLTSFTLPAGFDPTVVNPGLLEIRQGGLLVMTITLDDATGDYTVVQNAAIDHAALGDENNTSFSVGYSVTDQDGDTVDGTLALDVDDDTPTVSANGLVQLDDETETGGIAGGTGDVDPDTANTSGTLGHDFGADGGAIAWLTTGAPEGFSYELSGDNLLIKQGTTTVITVTLNTATGAYTVTQNAAIDHALVQGENNQGFTLSYQVTDGDGDTVDGTLALDVDDDTP
ncbi:MAG: DUF5801 repeats-in-toxin domain-containing protein, partial [Pseudomonadota bacterium]